MEAGNSTGIVEYWNLSTSSTPYNINDGEGGTFKYCGIGWEEFWSPYKYVHIYVAIGTCVIGCVTNMCSLFVFTRKEMKSPTNKILLTLALSDFLYVVAGLLSFSVELGTGGWCSRFLIALLGLGREILCVLFHAWSCYLTSLLAVWRFVGVTYSQRTKRLWTNSSANRAILSVITIATLLVIVMYSTFHTCDGTTYSWSSKCTWICTTILGAQLFNWITAIFLKILPCIVLLVSTTGLVWSLVKAEGNRANLRNSQHLQQSLPDPPLSGRSRGSLLDSKCERGRQSESYRATTRMLIGILLIFLITEFPQGILGMMTSVLGPQFYDECHSKIFVFTVLQEYISSVINFFVYLIMIPKFRTILCNKMAKTVTVISQQFSVRNPTTGVSQSNSD